MGKRRRKRPTGDKEKDGDVDVDPDPKSYEYSHDEIDAFHDRREKILISKGPLDVDEAESSSEEEVLGLGLEDSDDSEEDEKIVGYKKKIRQIRQTARKYKTRDDIADKEAEQEEGWGQKKSHYYGADIDDDDKLDVESGEDDYEQGGGALEEEKEALALQRKMAEELDEQDFGLEGLIATSQPEEDAKEEKIQKDLSKMSWREKLELFKKDSPEYLQLRDDFIEKMTTVRDVLTPIQALVKSGELPDGKAARYVHTRLQLYLNYCVNINFYMLLKSKQIPVQSHPVIKRILQYRNLIKGLENVDKSITKELTDILKKKQAGKPLGYVTATATQNVETKRSQSKSEHQTKKTIRKLKEKTSTTAAVPEMKKDEMSAAVARVRQMETSGEREAAMYYRMAHGLTGSGEGSSDEEAYDDTPGIDSQQKGDGVVAMETAEVEQGFDEKRSITYEMAKNKGLTSKKKKLLRNPRVKHRVKFKKALIKRRSAVREVKLPLRPYGGELSGIRAGLKHGTKLH